MSDFNEQLARMKGLMNYGKINENAKEYKNYTLEYHAEAADGKTYGIVRECNKYYIKQAEAGKELMAESYKYLGGFNNKKDYEYYSYANALKQFELKMASINEACDGKVNIETLNPFRNNAVLAEGTDKMKNEIARQRQIMYNASMLMNEVTTIGATPFSSQPESEHANSGDKDAPFTKPVKPDMTFDGEKSSCPKCEGEPFDKGEKCSCKAEKGKDVNVDGSVAGMKPKGGKVVRVNEGVDEDMFNAGLPGGAGTGDTQSEKFMDGAKTVNEEFEDDDFEGEEEGNLTFGNEEEEGDFEDNMDECGMNEEDDDVDFEDDEDMDLEDGDEEVEDEEEIDLEDGEGDDEDFEFGDDEDEEFDDEEDMDLEDDDFEGEGVDENDPEAIRAEIERLQSLLDDSEGEDEEFGDEFDMEGEENDEFEGEDEEEFDDEMDEVAGAYMPRFNLAKFEAENRGKLDAEEDGAVNEAKRNYMNSIVESVVKDIKKSLNEDTLHVFGQHPGYRKKPMTLPATGEDKNQHGEDWNDESVHNEQPFGSQIGSSAPFDDVVEKIAQKVLESLKKK